MRVPTPPESRRSKTCKAFLNACGAEITGGGHIHGGGPGRTRPSTGGTYTVLPDRHRGGHLPVRGGLRAGARSLSGTHGRSTCSAVTAALREAGCDVTGGSAGHRLPAVPDDSDGAIRPIRTAPYPGFPTDAQAILMAALLRCRGAAVFEENLFEQPLPPCG